MEVSSSERLEKWLLENAKMVVFTFVAVVILVLGYMVYEMVKKNQEEAAQAERFEIELALEKKQQEIFEAEAKAQEGAKTPQLPVRNPEVLQAQLGEPLGRLEAFVKENRSTVAGFLAAMTASDLYLEYKAPAKAAEILETVRTEAAKKNVFYGLIQSQLGLAYSNAGACDKAIEVYDQLLDVSAQKHLFGQTLVRKGACLIELQKYDEAAGVLRTARTEYPESSAAQTAESFERLIKIKKGRGE